MHSQLRPPLLAMMADPDPALRETLLKFWDSVLPQDLQARLLELLRSSQEGTGPWVRFLPLILLPNVLIVSKR